MGKRSDFEKRKNDAYDTWNPRAVKPLLPFLEPGEPFIEPCAGRGALIDLLETAGHPCVAAYDIVPRREDIEIADARTVRLQSLVKRISNPPWSRHILVPIILNLAPQGPIWLLLDADFMHLVKPGPRAALGYCHAIVSVGRLKWVEDTNYTAQDNAAWYLFGPDPPATPLFYSRT